jgi:hypothetical protein
MTSVDDAGNSLPEIYDKLIPILQQWKQQYNFVGTYFINVGDDANPTCPPIPTGQSRCPTISKYREWAVRSAITPTPT